MDGLLIIQNVINFYFTNISMHALRNYYKMCIIRTKLPKHYARREAEHPQRPLSVIQDEV